MTHVNLNTVISSNSVTAFNIEFEFNLDTKVFFSFFFKKCISTGIPTSLQGERAKQSNLIIKQPPLLPLLNLMSLSIILLDLFPTCIWCTFTLLFDTSKGVYLWQMYAYCIYFRGPRKTFFFFFWDSVVVVEVPNVFAQRNVLYVLFYIHKHISVIKETWASAPFFIFLTRLKTMVSSSRLHNEWSYTECCMIQLDTFSSLLCVKHAPCWTKDATRNKEKKEYKFHPLVSTWLHFSCRSSYANFQRLNAD